MTDLLHISVLGDSQTVLGTSYGTQAYECWPALMQSSLRRSGHRVRAHVSATGGHDTSNMLARISDAFPPNIAVPPVVVLAYGVNDAGVFSASQTQANFQAACKAIKHRAIGDGYEACAPVATVGALPSNGLFGQRRVVLSDLSTTGGTAAFDPAHHPTITGSVSADGNGQKQAVWEYRYPAPGETGWGRVATASTAPLTDMETGALLGAKHIVIVSTNYLNFTSGGDTPGAAYAANATIRGAQQAAVTAENGNGSTVTYADQYALERGLIVDGKIPDFSAVSYDQNKSFHYTSGNQHFSPLGHATRHQAVTPLVLAAIGADA